MLPLLGCWSWRLLGKNGICSPLGRGELSHGVGKSLFPRHKITLACSGEWGALRITVATIIGCAVIFVGSVLIDEAIKYGWSLLSYELQ